MADRDLDPGRTALLRALQEHEVEFVLIGGAAIESYGGSYRTEDLDVLPRRSAENLRRLADALNGLDCRLVVDPADRAQDVPLPREFFSAAVMARQDTWNLRTTHGDLDVLTTPAGFPGGYHEVQRRAQPRLVAATSIEVPIAALADIEHSKRTAGRPKDLRYLQSVDRLIAPPHDQRQRTGERRARAERSDPPDTRPER